MYTVLRFDSPTKDEKELTSLGECMNRIKQETFTGMDRVKGRFSCSICVLDNWAEHIQAMEQFLTLFSSVLAAAISQKINLEFDVAIEPEDCVNRLYFSTSLDLVFLKKLTEQNVGLTFTYYIIQNEKP